MTVLRAFCFHCLFVGYALLAICQQTTPIHVDRVVRVPAGQIQGFAFTAPTKSANDGTVYVRFAGSHRYSVTALPTDGSRVTEFSIDTVPELRGGYIVDFAPDNGGGVVALATVADREKKTTTWYLVTFTSNRSAAAKIDAAQLAFTPSQLAVFGNGDVFVAGSRVSMAKRQIVGHTPMAAIMDNRGQLRRYVDLPGDIDVKQIQLYRKNHNDRAGPISPIVDIDRDPQEDLEDVLSISYACSAPDGNVYFLRGMPNGPLYSVRPSGVVTRIALHPDKAGTGERIANGIRVQGPQVALSYYMQATETAPQHARFVLYDLTTGKLLSAYEPTDSQVGLWMVGFSPGEFMTLRSSSQGLQLVYAVP